MTQKAESLLITTLQEIERLTAQIADRLTTLEQRVVKIEQRLDALDKGLICLEQTEAQQALTREREIKTAILRTIGGAVGGGIVFVALKLVNLF
jgi:t-SNARE complex subunit (syntaxin)